jgi:hypothetical protein
MQHANVFEGFNFETMLSKGEDGEEKEADRCLAVM